MATRRFLAAAWVSVHWPVGTRDALTATLAAGFAGWVAGPTPRAVPWKTVRGHIAELPFAIAAVRVANPLEGVAAGGPSLASALANERLAARARVADAVSLARTLGCARVILDPGPVRVHDLSGPEDLADPRAGWTHDRAAAQIAQRNVRRDAGLDLVCRGLFDLLREHEGIEFCLEASRHVLGLGDAETLADLFEDLGAPRRLRYWHDAALVARRAELLGPPEGEWLERHSKYMAGITLGDCADGQLYLPPGAGGVDYPLLASYRRRSGNPIPGVVELDLGVEPGEIPGVQAFLDKFGL